MNRSEVITALQTEGRFESLEVASKGTSYGVYETYILKLYPAYVTLSSNMEGVTFLVDEDRVGVSDGKNLSLSLGPLIPGVYSLKATIDLNDLEMVNEKTQMIQASRDYTLIELPIEVKSFNIESNVDDPVVLFNGASIGQLESGYGVFGPFGKLEGAKVELVKEEAWGELRSSAVELTDDDHATYYLPFDKQLSISDAEWTLTNMYRTLSILTEDSPPYLDDTLERYDRYFYEGVAFDELRPFFIDYAERQRENEEHHLTSYDVQVTDFKQVEETVFTVNMEETYYTKYNWSSSKEDRTRTFSYTVSLTAADAALDEWSNQKELYISGFSGEQLIYDSNN